MKQHCTRFLKIILTEKLNPTERKKYCATFLREKGFLKIHQKGVQGWATR